MKSDLKALRAIEAAAGPPAPKRAPDVAERALSVGLLASVFIYVGLFLLGFRFFIYKTAVMPIFVVYGAVLRDRKAFLADWLPFLSGTILFDAIRGAIFVAIQHQMLPVFAGYVIWIEKTLFRTPAVPVVLQRVRSAELDFLMVFLHGLHFAFFLLFGLILWHLKRSQFDYFRRVVLLTMALGLMGYAIVPTVPPWLASSSLHLIPPVDHVVAHVYTQFIPELYGAFDSNPVAAMPSLHAAFPTVCCIVAWRAFGRRIGLLVGSYGAAVFLAVMYLGEHYAADVVAGVVVGATAAWLAISERTPSLTLRQSLAFTGVTLSVTVMVLLIAR